MGMIADCDDGGTVLYFTINDERASTGKFNQQISQMFSPKNQQKKKNTERNTNSYFIQDDGGVITKTRLGCE